MNELHPIEVAWRRFLVRDDSKLLLSDRTAPRTGASMTRWRSEMDSNRRSCSFRAKAAASCRLRFSVSADRRG